MQVRNKEEQEIEDLKQQIQSLYEKYKNDTDKLNLIEKELKEVQSFIIQKKEDIEYKKLLSKIKQ